MTDQQIIEQARNYATAIGIAYDNLDLEHAKRLLRRIQEDCDKYGSD